MRGVKWKPIKVQEQTYNKIILIKGTLEQTNRRPITIGDTVDVIFLAACRTLANRSGKALPQDFILEGLDVDV